MKILGINICSHDTSAALIVNGKLICATEEERFNKKKHTKDFPINSIKECLKISSNSIKDIDCIAVSTDPIRQIRKFWLEGAIKHEYRLEMMLRESEAIKNYYEIEKKIKNELNFKKKIKFYQHHKNHLSSCYYPSNFKKSLVVSYDGVGEGETALFAVANNGKLKVVHDKNLFPNSLGLIYAGVTAYLGWKYNCDESIIMGLASYGNPKNKVPKTNKSYIEIFRKIIKNKNHLDIQINKDWITFHKERNTWLSQKFIKVFGKRRNYSNKLTQHHKDIAAALQLRLEEIVLSQLRYLKKKFKISKICLAGGVALNCSMNGKIAKSKIFDEIFVQPASGDAGLAIGAAINCSKELQPKKKLIFKTNCYLGSRYSNLQIKKVLNKFKNKLKLINHFKKDIYDFTSDLLIKKKIIGWFQGPAEFGPRALGNRSILSSPKPYQIKNHINNKVKFRENFRPFAPAILHEYAQNYFNIKQKSEYMLIAFDVKKKMKQEISATVHIDNTCRVQTVTKDSNNKFYNLLKKMYDKTKNPVLLNTSFNIKGQPIVNSPEDAIMCFLKYKIDFLIIGDYILQKKS